MFEGHRSAPLRIFFGDFYSANTHYATALSDQRYGHFLTGVVSAAGGANWMHNRKPSGAPGDMIDEYDEYVDLADVKIQLGMALQHAIFTDLSGKEELILLQSESTMIPPNAMQMGTILGFWGKTKRLSKPYPNPDLDSPILVAQNETIIAPTYHTDFFALAATLWNPAGTVESSPSISGFGYAATSDNILVRLQHNYDPTYFYSLYRAPIIWDATWNRVVMTDVYKALDAYKKIAVPSSDYFEITADFADVAAVPYDSPDLVLEEPAINDGIARVAFDFQNRGRRQVGRLTQRWLILNPTTHTYFRGDLIDISPNFMSGVDFRDQDTANVTMKISEYGEYLDAAWDDPNNTALFSARVMTYV